MSRLSEAELLGRLRQAFLQYGFEALSMSDLARAAGLSRRALYYHYPNKGAAYRAMIRWQNEASMVGGLEAGQRIREAGGSPVDILAEIIDIRFGVTRRMVESSPHAVELNAVAFATCRDIAIDVATRFQQDLTDLISALVEDGVLRLRPSFSAAEIAQILAHGARGVNYALPPVPLEIFAEQYRRMCEAVVFGASVPGAKALQRSAPGRKGRERRKTRGPSDEPRENPRGLGAEQA